MAGCPHLAIGTHGAIQTTARASGRFRALTRFRDWDGQTRRVVASGESRNAATTALKLDLQERIRYAGTQGVLTPDSRFSELAEGWLDDLRMDVDRAESTKETYERQLRSSVLPFFSDFAVREITVGRMERYLKLQRQRSFSMAKHSKTTLSMVSAFGVRQGLLDRNPVSETSQLKKPKRGHRRHAPNSQVDCFTHRLRAPSRRGDHQLPHRDSPSGDARAEPSTVHRPERGVQPRAAEDHRAASRAYGAHRREEGRPHPRRRWLAGAREKQPRGTGRGSGENPRDASRIRLPALGDRRAHAPGLHRVTSERAGRHCSRVLEPCPRVVRGTTTTTGLTARTTGNRPHRRRHHASTTSWPHTPRRWTTRFEGSRVRRDVEPMPWEASVTDCRSGQRIPRTRRARSWRSACGTSLQRVFRQLRPALEGDLVLSIGSDGTITTGRC